MARVALESLNETSGAKPEPGRPSAAGNLIKTLRRYPQLIIGTLIVALFSVVAIGAPVLAPHPPEAQDLMLRFLPPIWSGGTIEHPLGTDEFGRDTLARIIYGARISLLVGVFSVVLAGTFGSALGLLSGYVGGKIDAFLMRVVDIQLAFPYILVAIVIASFWGAGFWAVIIALSITGWMGFARTVRSLVIGLKDSQYAEAAHAVGASHVRVMLKHLLPNMLGPLVVYTTFQIPTRILAEATLSFLGLGIQPPDASWGNMLAQSRGHLMNHPWLVFLPGISLSIVALGANMLGDGLRDFLDPRTRRR